MPTALLLGTTACFAIGYVNKGSYMDGDQNAVIQVRYSNGLTPTANMNQLRNINDNSGIRYLQSRSSIPPWMPMVKMTV